MFKNLIKTSLRQISRNRAYAVINVLSLTIGIAVSIVIYSFIKYEFTFDHFHTNADRVYRVNFHQQQDWGMNYNSLTPEPLHKVLRSDIPQIETVSRVIGPFTSNVFIENEKYNQNDVLFVDQYFTQLFDQEWIIGNPEEIFKDPKAVVLTESTAQKYFGDENPIGRIIDFARKDKGIVKGIVADPDQNTNLPYTMIAGIDMMKQIEEFYVREIWGAMSIGTTWVLLAENVDPESLQPQFEKIIEENLGDELAKEIDLVLGQLKSLHTDDKYGNGVNYTIPRTTVYLLIFIGAIILITSCINFVNLSTAQALKRGKEVGMRKILGSTKKQLASQFFVELGLLTTISAFIALWLAEYMLHLINIKLSIVDINLKLEFSALLFSIGLIILVTLVAGLYPVGLLTKFNSVSTLKSKMTETKGSKAIIRNTLLTAQFVFAQILLIIVLSFNAQFKYISNMDLGYDTENMLMFRNFVGGYYNNADKILSVKAQLEENPNIEDVSFGTGGPNASFAWGTEITEPLQDLSLPVDYKHVDIGYMDFFGLELEAGNWFTLSNYKDETQKVVVSNLLIEKLNWSSAAEAIGKKLIVNDRDAIIVGVLKDFHSDNLKGEIRPSVIEGDYEGYNQGFIKFKEGTFVDVAKHFEEVALRNNSDYTPVYSTYTAELEKEYEIDKLIFSFIQFITFLAIAVGCLGLYSLISFIAQQKTKEIGIRKAIGANTFSLMALLSSRYVWLILSATILAAPLGYLGANEWLKEFTYRTNIGGSIFLSAFIITAIIALGSVSYRAFKAASTNPVKSLRYD